MIITTRYWGCKVRKPNFICKEKKMRIKKRWRNIRKIFNLILKNDRVTTYFLFMRIFLLFYILFYLFFVLVRWYTCVKRVVIKIWFRFRVRVRVQVLVLGYIISIYIYDRHDYWAVTEQTKRSSLKLVKLATKFGCLRMRRTGRPPHASAGQVAPEVIN